MPFVWKALYKLLIQPTEWFYCMFKYTYTYTPFCMAIATQRNFHFHIVKGVVVKRVLFTVGHCLVSIVLITWCHIVMDLGYMVLRVRRLVNGDRCLVFVRPCFGQTDLHNEIKWIYCPHGNRTTVFGALTFLVTFNYYTTGRDWNIPPVQSFKLTKYKIMRYSDSFCHFSTWLTIHHLCKKV